MCAGECKYDFQAWGECDLATGKKNRTGTLKRALMDATCAATVTATKPCGKIPKTKLQGKLKRNKSSLHKMQPSLDMLSFSATVGHTYVPLINHHIVKEYGMR